MANKLSTEELQSFLEARAKEFANSVPNPAQAIKEQAASLRAFQEQVTKNFGETRSLLDSAKAFLKDPKAEGTRIVKDGLKAADGFFGGLFRLLTKDVGAAVKDLLSKSSSFVLGKIDTWLKGLATKVSKVTLDVGMRLSKVENKFAQSITRLLGSINTNVNRIIYNWGKTTGVSGLGAKVQSVTTSLKTIGTSITKNSQAIAALKDIPKGMGTLLAFARLGGKLLPILSTLADVKWKNDTRNMLVDIERKVRLMDAMMNRNHLAVVNKLNAIERSSKSPTIDYAKIASSVKTVIPSDLAKKSDVTSLSQGISKITSTVTALKIPSDLARKSDLAPLNYGQQLSTIAQGISTLKGLGTQPQPAPIDYSRIQNGITAAIATIKFTEPVPIDYSRIQNGINAAVATIKFTEPAPTDYSRIQNGINAAIATIKFPQQQTLDYTKVSGPVADALKRHIDAQQQTFLNTATASLSKLVPGDLARKADVNALQSGLNSAIANIKFPQQQTLDYTKVSQPVADALKRHIDSQQQSFLNSAAASLRTLVPADVARKSDVDAIPDKIAKTTIDLAPVISRLTTIDNTLVNLGQRFKPVDINPLQDKLSQIQNGVSQIPGQISNNLNTVSNSIVNSLTNFITNNNTTIINKMEPALNPDAIINPLKTHINTQVAQPLAITMDVLNVNDLKKGVTMSAEAVIKASGFQQYGQAGQATATNLIGLTAMIAAPIFMRAGFHQLGTEFPADIRNPAGAKVKPTSALSMSQWQFNQVSNLVGLPTKHLVKDASGGTTQQSFQNQTDIVENIHAQNLGMEQDLEALEKYMFKIAQAVEMIIQIVMQNKYDIDVLVDESGCKTKQKIVDRPGVFTHGKDDKNTSFFERLMNISTNKMVVREWDDSIDAKQLAKKTNMEAQMGAMSNKFEFDKADPKLPIVDRPKQNPKAQQDDEWQRYVNTSENPGTVRQSPGFPIPEIKEIRLGSDKEVPKPTKDPDKLLGS